MSEEKIVQTDIFFQYDTSFYSLYPPDTQAISKRHWTPLHVVKQTAEFLACRPGTRVLDIGSGIGKFCLAAARYAPSVDFIGVEQRGNLVRHAENVKRVLGLTNVSFIEANFTQINLHEFDYFYFFNAFYENLDDTNRIDESISYSEELYEYYVRYLRNGLRTMPCGTRVVTYHSLLQEIPREYKLLETLENGELNFWQKK